MAGLTASFFVQRALVRKDDDRFCLQKIVRFAYVKILSPVPFIAVVASLEDGAGGAGFTCHAFAAI